MLWPMKTKPLAPHTQVFRFRIADAVLAKIAKIAERDDRTMAYVIREFIEDGIDRKADESRRSAQ